MNMNMYDVAEESYKNGYANGYEDGKKNAIKHGHWTLYEKTYKDKTIGREWHCSGCNFIALSWTRLVDECRKNEPYEKPDWEYCPRCGCRMDEKG